MNSQSIGLKCACVVLVRIQISIVCACGWLAENNGKEKIGFKPDL